MAWYPGEEGGSAVADIIFGDVNPSGRLPVTFVKSIEQLPDFRDYTMKGRTYRFMTEDPLYKFGYGLSYTTFAYSKLEISPSVAGKEQQVKVSVLVKNTGKVAGEEVVQLYVKDIQASYPVPTLHLEGFKRVFLKPKESRVVSFTLKPEQLVVYDDAGKPFVEPGEFEISVGGGQPTDPHAGALTKILTICEDQRTGVATRGLHSC
jgi:beta-glucosidase